MSVPEITSAEGLDHYIGGKCLFHGRGEAWRDLKAWIVSQPPEGNTSPLPSVSEPFLAWTLSGEIDFQERENKGPWITNRIKKGSFFLTTGGAPYDVRWKAVTSEPFQAMFVFVELTVLRSALEEAFGVVGEKARLRDISAFTDDVLNSFMERIREELMREEASPLFVSAMARAIAVHIARNYAEAVDNAHRGTPSLPGYKLKLVTEWMAERLSETLNLDELAAKTGLSKFYFHRLFKRAIGLPPSRFQLDLRMNRARQLLRETKESIVDVALDVGYTNPSHFAKLFHKETGLTPSEYRRQR